MRTALTIHSSCLLRDVQYSFACRSSLPVLLSPRPLPWGLGRVITSADTSLRLAMWAPVTHHIFAAGYRSLIKIGTARYH